MGSFIAKWWRPKLGRNHQSHYKEDHLLEYESRWKDLARANPLMDWSEAPISFSVETGRWWYGCPEKFIITAGPLDRSGNSPAAIGFSMLNREPQGVTREGKVRPHKWGQSVRTMYWDLKNPTHVNSFIKVIRYLVAYVAEGRKDHFIGSHPIEGILPISNLSGDSKYLGRETVCIENKVMTLFRTTQVAHKRRWVEVPGGFANLASRFELPLSVVPKLMSWAKRYLPFLFDSKCLPNALDCRWVDSRWSTRVWEALEWIPEPALFESPHLYEDCDRVVPNDPSSIPFTRAYLERLLALEESRVRWKTQWSSWEDRMRSTDDRFFIVSLFKSVWTSIVFLQALYWTFLHSPRGKFKPKRNLLRRQYKSLQGREHFSLFILVPS